MFLPTSSWGLTSILFVWFFALSEGWLFSRNENCYRSPDIGCFPTSRPFTNTMGFSPESPHSVDVHFVYDSDTGPMRIQQSQTPLWLPSLFNPTLKSILIIHGYMEGPNRPWIHEMKDELRMQEPMNIFVVDWTGGAYKINYLQSAANARVAGALIGLFLQELIDLGASPSSLHLIGFSLGAHVAGYAGSRVPGLGRITGLDPAGPGFYETHPSVHLDATDATIVDVIHTDVGLGTLMPFGSLDFYPNGGANQPECDGGAMQRLSSFIAGMDFSRNSVSRAVGCSHIRAPLLFTASINNPCTFNMVRFQSVDRMNRDDGWTCAQGECPRFGYHIDSRETIRPGIYRFDTAGSRPYC